MLVPAFLSYKEPDPRIQSFLVGALERKIPPLGGILLAPRWFFMATYPRSVLEIKVGQSAWDR